MRIVIAASTVALLLAAGCSKTGETSTSSPAPAADGGQTPDQEPPAGEGTERPSLTAAECEAKGGQIVGDIGDGAIHRPDYTCPSGHKPLGSIAASGDGPIAVEGSVCCPAA